MKELLDNGANTNIQDENGWTFSHHSTDGSSEVDGVNSLFDMYESYLV